VPLSEHEQRILAELEESLVRHDPAFAERVRAEGFHHDAHRRCRWAAAGVLAGAVITIAFFSTSVLVGFLGVVMMFTSALAFERNLRRTGRAGWRGPSRAAAAARRQSRVPVGRVDDAVRSARSWIRGRLHRDR
jgi:hypothetical protein